MLKKILLLFGLLIQFSNAESGNINNKTNLNYYNAYDFSFPLLNNDTLDLNNYRNHSIMLIILPDKCNFNVKYFEFNELKEKFYDQKIIFIGVTTNYFETIDQNNNELPLLDSNCKINYNFDFFITKPIKVKGKESHMFFKWLKCDHNYQCFPKDDYHQILIGKDGEIFGYYPNNIPIKSAYIMDQINKSLLK